MNLLKEIDKEASFVHYRNIKTEDVGKQFVDLESRLKTKREVQRRYEDILRRKAGTIEDLLAAEKQIGNLQEEIESTISRLNYLKDEVAFSTINLQMYEVRADDVVAESGESMNDNFREAFLAGLKGTVEILIALTRVRPLLLIITTVLVIYLRRKREGMPV